MLKAMLALIAGFTIGCGLMAIYAMRSGADTYYEHSRRISQLEDELVNAHASLNKERAERARHEAEWHAVTGDAVAARVGAMTCQQQLDACRRRHWLQNGYQPHGID
jgi:hypothetical protein